MQPHEISGVIVMGSAERCSGEIKAMPPSGMYRMFCKLDVSLDLKHLTQYGGSGKRWGNSRERSVSGKVLPEKKKILSPQIIAAAFWSFYYATVD